MNLRLSLLASAIALAAVAGCYTGTAVDTNQMPRITVGSDPTEPASDGPTSDDDDVASEATGLPCDLAVLLETSCGECHGAKRPKDGPIPIATYADLTAPWASEESKTVAQVSLSRMKSTKRPMPPNGKLGTDEISILEKWIDDGMPKGACGEDKPNSGQTSSTKDAGTHEAPPPPASVCTSANMDAGEHDQMHPGKACVSCHTDQGGPSFTVAGTLYPTVREPDECHGTDGTTTGAKVILIDATGTPRLLAVNAAGNFKSMAALTGAYRAIVVRGNSIREMKSTQTDGDCNSCHTETGIHGAPGRIMEP